MNRINQLLKHKPNNILSIYFCAGHPHKDSTMDVLRALQANGIDMAEIGIPFSDPMADGPVIQQAATTALHNGMSLKVLFDQLNGMRQEIHMPLLLMGYLNVIMHYGFDAFFSRCAATGVSGCIIPDLPFADYLSVVKPIADKYDIRVIMMITPETSADRIRLIDSHTDGFIYMVSSAGITGAQQAFGDAKIDYFRRIDAMNLRNPRMIGFGISNRQTLESAQAYAAGTIIGSKFVSLLDETMDADKAIDKLNEALAQ